MNTSKNIITRFEDYLEKEDHQIVAAYQGYEAVELYVSPTLADAWLMARPDEEKKFENSQFFSRVNAANGKWLEPREPGEPYKIILEEGDNFCIERLVKTYVHELRHVLDYMRATADMPFSQRRPGNLFFNQYSEYNAEKSATRYLAHTWLEERKMESSFDCLSAILGILTADAVHGAINSKTIHDVTYYIARYLGAQRAIRDLSDDVAPSHAFHLWHLTPLFFEESYGSIFYLANELDDLDPCPLDASSWRFDDLIERVSCGVLT